MSGAMVIVGAGECGARAAQALREHGFTGRVVLVGAEGHLPYERPPLSKQMMTAAGPLEPRTIVSLDRLHDLDIEFRHSSAVAAIDRAQGEVLLADGARLAYDRLLLATGATPRALPTATAPGAQVIYLRNLDDARSIRRQLAPGRRLIIVGGGFIGLELAASARSLGATVTIIEALPRLLARAVPEALAARLETRHREAGVTILLGRSIAHLAGGGEGASVTLLDDTRVDADLVVVGIGAVPTTALAEAAGLVLDNGIAADARLRTSDASIYAAGDCCSFPLALYGNRRVRLESWRNAQEQGTLAARNMLGAEADIESVPWFWSDQYELGLQISGLADEGRQTVARELEYGSLLLFHCDHAGRLVAAAGIGPGNAVARDIKLAELLIAKRAVPTAAQLADPSVKLKSLLAA
jgi:3-phenylpropionate/trans-cinnamate dioxygenase ferredoxin reductase subunit